LNWPPTTSTRLSIARNNCSRKLPPGLPLVKLSIGRSVSHFWRRGTRFPRGRGALAIAPSASAPHGRGILLDPGIQQLRGCAISLRELAAWLSATVRSSAGTKNSHGGCLRCEF
jgi:hypothetical protein